MRSLWVGRLPALNSTMIIELDYGTEELREDQINPVLFFKPITKKEEKEDELIGWSSL